jgi:hypothetical protein
VFPPEPGSPAFWLMVLIAIGWSLLTLWCIVDSFTHTDLGCVWAILLIGPLNPLTVPFYFFSAMYSRRNVSPRKLSQLGGDPEEYDITRRFASEFERAKFIEAASRGGGTMYDAGMTVQKLPEGKQHFRDDRAEELLKEARFDEAWIYLIDLYALSQDGADWEREETYRHYISRLPEGLTRLNAWQRGERGTPATDAPVEPKRRAITDSTSATGTTQTQQGKRDLPF